MADQGTWQDVEIPRPYVSTRLPGRSRLLMDFASAAAARALIEFLKEEHRLDLSLIPSFPLEAIQGQLLRFLERVSDELDRRVGPQ